VNASPTLAIPDLAPHTILKLRKEDWRYGGHDLLLRVERVRHDLSTYYDNEWVWITGDSLRSDGSTEGRTVALVRVAVLPIVA